MNQWEKDIEKYFADNSNRDIDLTDLCRKQRDARKNVHPKKYWEKVWSEYILHNDKRINSMPILLNVAQTQNDVQIGGANIYIGHSYKRKSASKDSDNYEIRFKSKGSDIWGIDSQTIEHEKEHLRLQDSSDNASYFDVTVPKFGGDTTKQRQYLEYKIENECKPEYLKRIKEMHNRWDKKDGSTGPTFEDVNGYYENDTKRENETKVKFAPMPTPELRVPVSSKK
jgi:hypothetical protein